MAIFITSCQSACVEGALPNAVEKLETTPARSPVPRLVVVGVPSATKVSTCGVMLARLGAMACSLLMMGWASCTVAAAGDEVVDRSVPTVLLLMAAASLLMASSDVCVGVNVVAVGATDVLVLSVPDGDAVVAGTVLVAGLGWVAGGTAVAGSGADVELGGYGRSMVSGLLAFTSGIVMG